MAVLKNKIQFKKYSKPVEIFPILNFYNTQLLHSNILDCFTYIFLYDLMFYVCTSAIPFYVALYF